MEAGRTAGRSNAKDCADIVIVVRWLLEALAQLRFAAAGLGGSDRPPCERCSCNQCRVSDAQTPGAPSQFPSDTRPADFATDVFAPEVFEAGTPRDKRELLAVFKDSKLARGEGD
jgi:hypothetical protein